MPNDSRDSVLPRLVLIGVVLLVVAGLFAYAGGWLSPHRLTPSRMMDAFQDDNGPHPGFRRNHSKGVCVSGWFQSSSAALSLSKAQVFQPGQVPVVGRLDRKHVDAGTLTIDRASSEEGGAGAALLHGLIRRDGVFESMASVSSSRSSRRA